MQLQIIIITSMVFFSVKKFKIQNVTYKSNFFCVQPPTGVHHLLMGVFFALLQYLCRFFAIYTQIICILCNV